jgi:hypothetical protein
LYNFATCFFLFNLEVVVVIRRHQYSERESLFDASKNFFYIQLIEKKADTR